MQNALAVNVTRALRPPDSGAMRAETVEPVLPLVQPSYPLGRSRICRVQDVVGADSVVQPLEAELERRRLADDETDRAADLAASACDHDTRPEGSPW